MRYVLRKTGVLLVTLLAVTLLAYLAFQIIPGDPTTMLLGTEYTPERAEALRESLGLNRNVFVRYGEWLWNLLRGDAGVSYGYAMPVSEVLRGKVAVLIYDNAGTLQERVVLGPGEGRFGLNVPKGVWHTLECLEPGTVLFESKEGPFVPHEQEGVLDIIQR